MLCLVCMCLPHCVVEGSWTGELSQPERHLSSQSSSSPPHQRPATTRTYIWMTQWWQLSRAVCISLPGYVVFRWHCLYQGRNIHIAINYHLSLIRSAREPNAVLQPTTADKLNLWQPLHSYFSLRYIRSIYVKHKKYIFFNQLMWRNYFKSSHNHWHLWQEISRHGAKFWKLPLVQNMLLSLQHYSNHRTSIRNQLPPPAKCRRLWAKAILA